MPNIDHFKPSYQEENKMKKNVTKIEINSKMILTQYTSNL